MIYVNNVVFSLFLLYFFCFCIIWDYLYFFVCNRFIIVLDRYYVYGLMNIIIFLYIYNIDSFCIDVL